MIRGDVGQPRCQAAATLAARRPRPGAALIGLAATIVMAGCGPVYLHDPANLGAAQKAQQQFAAVVQEGRSASLVAGQRQQRQALGELDGALDGIQRDVQIAALSSKSWGQLADEVAAERAEVDVELAPPAACGLGLPGAVLVLRRGDAPSRGARLRGEGTAG